MVICSNGNTFDILDGIKFINISHLFFWLFKIWLLDNLKLCMWFTFVAYILFLLDSVGQDSMKNDVAFLGSSHKMNYFFSHTSCSTLGKKCIYYLVSNVGVDLFILSPITVALVTKSVFLY